MNDNELTPQELFALHQGLPPAARAETAVKERQAPAVGLPHPHPPEYPPGNDEGRTYEQYYRAFWRTKVLDIDLSGNPAAGQRIQLNWVDSNFRGPARSLIVDNLSGYSFLLYVGLERVFIGPSVYNFIRPLPDVPNEISLFVYSTGAVAPVVFTFAEQQLPPNAGTVASVGGLASSVNVAQIGGAAIALGPTTPGASLPVVVDNTSSIPVTIGAPVTLGAGSVVASVGTAGLATAAVTIGAGATAVCITRATKSSVTIRSRPTNNPNGITFPGGAILFPGDSITLTYTQGFSVNGTAGDVVDVWEVF